MPLAYSLVKVVLLSKNEYDLIDDFLLYYGNIFGFNNIIVIDNESNDMSVIDIYNKYRTLGVTFKLEAKRDMAVFMAQILTEAMNYYKHTCKFLLPLFTDEFIYLPFDEKYGISFQDTKHIILEYFNTLPSDVSIIRYVKLMASIVDTTHCDYKGFKHTHPAQSIINFYDHQGSDKLIIHISFFHAISTGNHHAMVTGGRTVISELLGLLQFHDTGAARMKERCIIAMSGYKHMNVKQLNV